MVVGVQPPQLLVDLVEFLDTRFQLQQEALGELLDLMLIEAEILAEGEHDAAVVDRDVIDLADAALALAELVEVPGGPRRVDGGVSSDPGHRVVTEQELLEPEVADCSCEGHPFFKPLCCSRMDELLPILGIT